METVIFHKQYKKGIFRRKVISDARITNFHVCLTNYNGKGQIVYDNCIPLEQSDDIVTLNNHRVGGWYQHGITYGSYYRGYNNFYGVSNWQSYNVADIAFIKHSVPIITFRDVQDANGVVKMAKVAMYSTKGVRR
jgi:hypothetical protein